MIVAILNTLANITYCYSFFCVSKIVISITSAKAVDTESFVLLELFTSWPKLYLRPTLPTPTPELRRDHAEYDYFPRRVTQIVFRLQSPC